jgi:hypothetical protein
MVGSRIGGRRADQVAFDRRANVDRDKRVRPGSKTSQLAADIGREVGVSLLKRLLGRNDPPKPRVRVCVECGMPVAEHKDWCSILRGQIEMKRRSEAGESPLANQ